METFERWPLRLGVATALTTGEYIAGRARRRMMGVAYGMTGPVVATVSYDDVLAFPKRALLDDDKRIVWAD